MFSIFRILLNNTRVIIFRISTLFIIVYLYSKNITLKQECHDSQKNYSLLYLESKKFISLDINVKDIGRLGNIVTFFIAILFFSYFDLLLYMALGGKLIERCFSTAEFLL